MGRYGGEGGLSQDGNRKLRPRTAHFAKSEDRKAALLILVRSSGRDLAPARMQDQIRRKGGKRRRKGEGCKATTQFDRKLLCKEKHRGS
jgi:hypothetical protein